jgi:hypothetical protein
MSTPIVELHERYRALQQAEDRQRRTACQAFCHAVISAQRRGELGIVPAAALIEGALQSPELSADELLAPLREKAAALQSPLQAAGAEPLTAWRELVKSIDQLTP